MSIIWKMKDNDNKNTTIADVVRKNIGDEKIPDEYAEIKNLEAAAKRIAKAIYNEENIFVCGDYDSDGVCSCAVLYKGFNSLYPEREKALPIDRIRLPRRFSEGYGLSNNMVEEITADKGLLITIDNGIAAIEAIKRAKEKGLEVIIVDHHLPSIHGIPEADIIVDPHVYSGDFNDYCAAGLAYQLVRKLWEVAFEGDLPEALEQEILAIGAIGTVGDIVPLLGGNRKIVREGLEILRSGKNLPAGIVRLLAETQKVNAIGQSFLTETDIAFGIVPYLNACGRMIDDGAKIALRFLVATALSDEEIRWFMAVRDERKARQEIDAEKALSLVEKNFLSDRVLVVHNPDLHEGIVGIVASNLTEKYHRPAIVLTNKIRDGIVYCGGSGRTYGDINLKQLLDTTSSFLYRYGGHKGAAGCSLLPENLEAFRKAIQAYAPPVPDEIQDYYDLELPAGKVDMNLYEELAALGPYGEGNPKIRFMIKDMSLTPKTGLGFYQHLGSNEENIKLFSKSADIIAFGLYSRYKEIGEPLRLNLVATLDINSWQGGQKLQIEALDLLPMTTSKPISPLQALLEQRMREKTRSVANG